MKPATPPLHPRNSHRGHYDFPRLQQHSPELAVHVRTNPRGEPTIDFADPVAVLALNRTLLRTHYGVHVWELPPGYLCPPIPGRADYVHHAADLLAADLEGSIPRGPGIAVLDIGVGANCIYPIVGRHEYGWRFVGSEIDALAVESARHIVAANPGLRDLVECREQMQRDQVLHGVIQAGEKFALTLCNPPFHASAAAAASATQRKQRNLSAEKRPVPLRRNFGGRANELWCPGGEIAFVSRLMRESRAYAAQCAWFTSLVASRDSLPALERELARVRIAEVRTIAMAQGAKRSRFLAWTFLPAPERRALLRGLSAAKVSGT